MAISAYKDCWTLSQDAAYQQAVRYAIDDAAQQIQSEAVNTANHVRRSRLAYAVLNNPQLTATILLSFALAVTTDASVRADTVITTGNVTTWPTDAHIANAVSGLWDAIAGKVD